MVFDVWLEGFMIDRDSGSATYLGSYEAETFKAACRKALQNNNYEMNYYNSLLNTFWGCNFYDNEIEARKKFG